MGIFICYYYILYVVQYSTYFLVHLYIILWYNTAQTGGTDPYCTYCPCSLESSFVPSTQRVKGRTYVSIVLSCLVLYTILFCAVFVMMITGDQFPWTPNTCS
jgi:hypothetical protein